MQHLRFALRSLMRSPGFAGVAIATLAVGIGAVTAIFSLLQAALLSPLPYPNSQELVSLHMTLRQAGSPETQEFGWSYPKYLRFKETTQSFRALAAFSPFEANLTGSGTPERIRLEIATASYLPVLGVAPVAGRGFVDSEDVNGGGRVALISWGLWQRVFATDPSAVGRTLRINGKPVTIVGILPRDFSGLGGEAEVWVPFGLASDFVYPGAETEAGNHWHAAIGRLQPGVSVARAKAEATAIGPSLKALDPETSAESQWGVIAQPLETFRVDPTMRRATLLLFGAVLVVLAIACANVAALLLARSAGRERELAIRAAIGAGRGRLVRQLLSESLVLSLAGGACGTIVALWATSFLSRLTPETSDTPGGYSYLFRFASLQVDARVLLFALIVSIATGLAFGLLPALQASKTDPAQGLKDGSPTAGGPGGARLRRLLVPAQVALATVLLIAAGLLTTSLIRLQRLPTGFNPANVLTFRIQPPENAEGRRDPAVVQRIVERIAVLPGVDGASAAFCAPGAGRCMVNVVRHVDATNVIERGTRTEIGVQPVSPGYFATMEIRILHGRGFTDADHAAGAPRVVLLNENAAKAFWPQGNAVGQRIGITNYYFGDGETAQVIGIVANVRNGRPDEAPMADAYIPLYSRVLPSVAFLVRTEGDPGATVSAVRRAVAEVDGTIAIYRVETMEERLADVVSRQRLSARLLSLLAAVAAFLSAVGLYGLIAESVTRRTREIGVRMALGARPAEVRRRVFAHGFALFAVGLSIGLAAAAALSRLMTTLLFETRPADPTTYLAVAVLLGLAAAAACWIPARRATRIDPMAALRSE